MTQEQNNQESKTMEVPQSQPVHEVPQPKPAENALDLFNKVPEMVFNVYRDNTEGDADFWDD